MPNNNPPNPPNLPGGSRFERALRRMDKEDTAPPAPVPEDSTAPTPIRQPLQKSGATASATDRPDHREQSPATTSATKSELTLVRRLIWQGKVWEAFQTTVILLSFTVNLILIVIVFFLGQYIFTIKDAVAEPLIGGLYAGFGDMDNATIQRTIPVNDEIPVVFDLPIDQVISVILTEDVPLRGMPTVVNLGAGNTLTGTVDITLPAGTPLPIQLTMVVPVATTVPVVLDVEAVIPLNETELHGPFSTFQTLFAPYNDLIQDLPDSWSEVFQQAFSGR